MPSLARRDDGIFITTRFAPGIILGTFPRDSRSGGVRRKNGANEGRRGEGTAALLRERVRDSVSTVGNEFACRLHVLPAFFLMPLARLANVENMLRKLAYDGSVLLSVTYLRETREREERGGRRKRKKEDEDARTLHAASYENS